MTQKNPDSPHDGVLLDVPSEALEVLLNYCGHDGYDSDEDAEDDIRRISRSVVAAELRRLAPLLHLGTSPRDLLRERADELDGGE